MATTEMRVSDADLCQFAEEKLQWLFGQGFGPSPELIQKLESQLPCQRVNVTLRTGGRLRGSMSSDGSSLAEQLSGALKRAALDKRFGSRITAVEISEVDLEIWLQLSSENVTPEECAEGKILAWGLEGVEIAADGRGAYYKPSVPLTAGKNSVKSLMSSLCKKARLPKERWRSPGASITRTRWHSVVRAGERVLQHKFEQFTPSLEEVAAWASDSVKYLLNSRQASGDFTYLYDPTRDLERLEKPSRVRSAGCLYALSAYLDSAEGKRESTQAALIESVAGAQVAWTVRIPDIGRLVPERRSSEKPKMGATALLALALGGKTLQSVFRTTYEELTATIDAAHMENYRFQTHLGTAQEVSRSSDFFSGQALLTLVQRAEQGDVAVLRRAELAFKTYRNQFMESPSSAFAGWHVDVWTRMALLTGRDDYASFAFHQADWLLRIQIQSSDQPLWTGGFSPSKRWPKYNSVVFLEAVTRAYILARKLNLRVHEERYSRAIRLGIGFCSVLRIPEHYSSWFPNPKRARGGVSLSITDLKIRCDLPQHFITLCLCLLQTPELLR